LKIAKELGELTKYESTDDLDELKERQEAALERANKYRKTERKKMKEAKADFEEVDATSD
jgi:hypothetical protein